MFLPSLYIIIVYIIELYYLVLNIDSKTYQYKTSSFILKTIKTKNKS
jgi:hypothetical protein